MTDPRFVPFRPFTPEIPATDAARAFAERMSRRRSIRMFSDRPVERATIEQIVRAAGTAPSGANKQPWRFVAIADPALKREIRMAAEAEEREFYTRRASEAWLRDLYPFGTDDQKPFIEIAPWIIVVFKLMKDDDPSHESDQVYYVNESVGIAVGLLIAAAHHAGLATLTHTPSPMKFLTSILNRPAHERPFLLIPVGYPASDCVVPDIHRKPLSDILVFDRGDGPGASSSSTVATVREHPEPMSWLLFVVAVLFAVYGLACVALIAVGLPGTWMIIAGAVLIEVTDSLYLPEGSTQTFPWWLLIACMAIAILGEIFELTASAFGAKKGGASRAGMVGAFIGGIGGAILGISIPVPLVGSLIGAIVGTFVGAIVGELRHEAATVRGSMKPAAGATIGRVLGTVGKMAAAMSVWCALTVAAFWP